MASSTGNPGTLSAGQKAELPPLSRSRAGYYVMLSSAVFLLYVYSSARVIDLTSADLGRHLKNGEIIVNSGTIPRTNLFSYTYPNFPFVNHHWGTGVIYYLVCEWTGFKGLRLLNMALELGAVMLLFALAWYWTRCEIAVLAAILAEPLIGSRGEVRPEFFSYLFIAIYFVLLWQYREKKLSGRWLWVLPVLEVFWVNLHIYFPFGPLLVGAFLVDELLPRMRGTAYRSLPRVRLLLAVLLSCCAATLINPWGFTGSTYPLMIFRSYGFLVYENESSWQHLTAAPPAVHFAFVFALVLVGAGWTALAPRGRDRQLALLLLTLVFGFLGWRYLRCIAMFGYLALVALPLFWNRAPVLHFIDSLRKGIAVGVLCCLAVLYFAICPEPWMYRDVPGLGLAEGNLNAIRFFHDNKLHGPIFNTYNIGNYLVYGLYPEERVFVDGRPEAYPPAFFRQTLIPLLITLDNEEHWKSLMAQYEFNVLIMQTKEVESQPGYLSFFVRRSNDPLWAAVFVDNRVVIFLRRTPENKAIIDRFEVNLDS